MSHDPVHPQAAELTRQIEELRDRVAELESECVEIRSSCEDRERQLLQIHRSKMWRLWMLSIAARRAIGRLVSWPHRLLRRCARLMGTAYLMAYYTWHQLLAGLRRTRPFVVPTDAEPPHSLDRPLRLLIVMPYHIVPPDHGGGTRLFNLVRELGNRTELYLLIFSRTGDDPGQRATLSPWCRAIFFHHWTPDYHPDLFGLMPINPQFFMAPEVTQQIRHIVDSYAIDAVQLEYTELGQYVGAVPAGVPVTLTEHDIAFETHRRRRALAFHERFAVGALHDSTMSDWLAFFRFEIRACRAAHSIHTMSELDAELLRAFLPAGGDRLRVAPNGVDVAYYRANVPISDRSGVLFVGNFENYPNLDGVEFFVSEVWPIIRGRRPDCSLRLVGAFADQRLGHLDGTQGISVCGRVPDLRPEYRAHRVMVAPIRAGSGTRLKILEALASGIPVVSTTIGAEGLAAHDGTHCLIADQPAEFAEQVLRILDDDALAQRLAAAGEALVEARYDWGPIAEVILRSHAALVRRFRGTTRS